MSRMGNAVAWAVEAIAHSLCKEAAECQPAEPAASTSTGLLGLEQRPFVQTGETIEIRVETGCQGCRFVADETARAPDGNLTEVEDRRRQPLIPRVESRLRAVLLNGAVVSGWGPAARRPLARLRRCGQGAHALGNPAHDHSVQ